MLQASQHDMRSFIESAAYEDAPAAVRKLVLSQINYIQSALTVTGGRVLVDVVNLDLNMARYWHNAIQPHINRIDGRADRGWDWRRILLGTGFLAKSIRQKPAGLALVVNLMPDYPALIPVAMLQLVNNYPHFEDHKRKSTFLWYLADAPEAALRQLVDKDGAAIFSEEKIPKGLGSAALDSSIIHSFREDNAGRLGLHADSKGEDRLFDWYLKKGMINLSASEKLPLGFREIRWGNDGRYFYYNKEDALEVARKTDSFR